LKQQILPYIEKWEKIDKQVQTQYDVDTNGGLIQEQQKLWNENWERFVNGILKQAGWTQ
jgi:hypothetical protein